MSQEALRRPLLSKYPLASFRELAVLTIPLMLSFLSYSLMTFCDRIFLSHYSVESLHGCVIGGYLWNMFQHPFVRLVSLSQVFVGLHYGANRNKVIGSFVWQMIWLSLFSMIITLPLGMMTAPLVFKDSNIAAQAQTYFSALMWGNFLFPLGTAISTYFVGQGKGGVIVTTTITAHLFNVLLDYALIFGIKGIFPPCGEFGAALATNISQLIYCAILLGLFLKKHNRDIYGTDQYHLHWPRLWTQLKVAFPRALTRFIILMNWVFISRVITLKGGDYLMVLSIGGTLIMLFTFVGEGMLQGQTMLASNLIGSGEYNRIGKLIHSGLLFLLVIAAFLAIPYLLFPKFTLGFFFNPQATDPQTFAVLKRSCFWLWLFFLGYGYEAIGWSLLFAARDTVFSLFQALLVWITGYLPVYFLIGVLNGPADILWLIMAISLFISGSAALVRGKIRNWQTPKHSNISLNV